MSKQPLTATALAKLKPSSTRIEISDSGAKGLAVVVQPSGAKSWVMRFRRPDGRPGKLTLGAYSAVEASGTPVLGAPLTLAQARWLAAETNRQRASGRDVVADYKAEKERQRAAVVASSNAFGAVVRDFIEEHARPKTRRWHQTARELGLEYPQAGEPTERAGGLAARWRVKPIDEIDGSAIYALVDEARRRGVPGVVPRNTGISDARGRAMARTLSKLFGWLHQHRRISVNPCAGVYCPPPPAKRERVLSASEVRWFWLGCDAIGEPFGALFKLLLLTGARREEVAGMKRSELVDAETGLDWQLPGSRTKNKLPFSVPLSPLAREILADVKQIAGKPGFVFTTNGRTSVSGFSKLKGRLDREMLAAASREVPNVEIAPWRLHDLRRTAATGMAEIGIAPHIVEACLNHISGAKAAVAGVYNRAAYVEEKRVALDRWAVHVVGVVAQRRANVVAINSGRV